MSENIKGQSEEIRSFASRLRQFSIDMKSNQSQLRGQFNQVSNTWRDSVQQKFSEEMRDVNRLLDQFLREVDEEYLPHLEKKATEIDTYLGH